jgi:hypothetical protein
VGLSASAGASDGLRIHVVDEGGTRVATLLEVSGDGTRHRPAWRSFAAPLPAGFGGRQLALELVAVDAGADATVEAGIDQVRVIAT